ncbi:MAG TPA: tRNA (adenosine(37)-N6)-threonylcarbamoyltransferase complex ATPase subunit type 1 TsaE [Pusillimonas sp.]|uniref:tRNA (adenosine(37)-N6)-threonylcarbamoyltransferase complex ATPase subunit type 1 TsaE n=1 Tax=unclassified Pusillimonas TaxID=2640016 RepID=UPI0026294FC4|nr:MULTISPECIES: tRNA (adenosine(37)-N6)-threonylcarbamoyltransferase complex ATPase subunit type 1 TsaE [unclassified Pusillimonas]HLU19323.1 tRNA (adenosine(37)-N6)-threonylcarbamoyltransferase complex ATPase subunit type 1 TsaE [Pusillimonas sp.]
MQNRAPLAEVDVFLANESVTDELAGYLAPLVMQADEGGARGGHIHLKGDLGAGKTHFTRALLRACGVTGRIKSPSYALLESYKVSNLYFYHLDFYRFADPREWIDAGFRDLLQKQAVVLIEWPEQAGSLLPAPDLEITLVYEGDGRKARLAAYSNKGQTWLTSLAPHLQEFPPRDSPAAGS